MPVSDKALCDYYRRKSLHWKEKALLKNKYLQNCLTSKVGYLCTSKVG